MGEESSLQLSRGRKVGFAVLALGLGLGVGVLLAEIGARIWFRDMPANLVSKRQFYRASDDPLRIYELVPNHETPEGDTLNSLGLRGPEITLEKPSGVLRVAVLGDSHTFGQGVAEPDTWVRRLEDLLRQELERPVEVLNFGVPGYNTKNELGTLEWVFQFEPNLVLLAHLINDDMWDIMRLSQGALVFHTEADLESKIPLPRAVQRRLYRWSLAYRLAATQYLRGVYERQKAERGSEVSEDAIRGWQADEDRIDKERLTEFFERCRQENVPAVLVQMPVVRAEVQEERTAGEARVTRNLRSLAEEQRVPMLDLFPLLQGIDGTPLQVAPGDGHPGPELHGRYAERIAEWLIETFVNDSGEPETASEPG